MDSEQTSEKQIAINAVLKAAPLCQRVQTDMVEEDAIEKEDKTPVTVADLAAQALICQAIGDEFPDYPIVAEEDSQELQKYPISVIFLGHWITVKKSHLTCVKSLCIIVAFQRYRHR